MRIIKAKIKRGLLLKEGKTSRPNRNLWNGFCIPN